MLLGSRRAGGSVVVGVKTEAPTLDRPQGQPVGRPCGLCLRGQSRVVDELLACSTGMHAAARRPSSIIDVWGWHRLFSPRRHICSSTHAASELTLGGGAPQLRHGFSSTEGTGTGDTAQPSRFAAEAGHSVTSCRTCGALVATRCRCDMPGAVAVSRMLTPPASGRAALTRRPVCARGAVLVRIRIGRPEPTLCTVRDPRAGADAGQGAGSGGDSSRPPSSWARTRLSAPTTIIAIAYPFLMSSVASPITPTAIMITASATATPG